MGRGIMGVGLEIARAERERSIGATGRSMKGSGGTTRRTGKVRVLLRVGTFHYMNGEKYEGDWKEDWKEGVGKWYYTNGSYFDGEWRGDNINGKGTCYYINGNKYEGEWRDNKRCGTGTCYYANGEKYQGQYKDDKRDGRGNSPSKD